MAFSRFCGTEFLPVVVFPRFSLSSFNRSAWANRTAADGESDAYGRRSSCCGYDRTTCYVQLLADLLNAITMTITHPREFLKARLFQFEKTFISRPSNLVYSCSLSGKNQPAFLAFRRSNIWATFSCVTSCSNRLYLNLINRSGHFYDARCSIVKIQFKVTLALRLFGLVFQCARQNMLKDAFCDSLSMVHFSESPKLASAFIIFRPLNAS